MSENTLTNDEKKCLQMWFRQAIVEVERREACAAIAKFYDGDRKTGEHKTNVATRRQVSRSREQHAHELV